jgi:hypothetical protein
LDFLRLKWLCWFTQNAQKGLTSVRSDADILEFFKSKGAGYQSRINAALRMEVERHLAGDTKAAARKRIAA